MIISLGDIRPDISAARFVAASADVAGHVILHRDSSVFYGAVLRSETEAVTLGEDSNLQDGVVVHTDVGFPTTVGARVSVGHRAVLHGCTVEDDCLIGMGAVVLNGAVIGSGSLVAAGAVVAEGVVIPPRSLVAGVPGKVKRTIDDEGFAKIQLNAAHYLDIAAAHAAAVGQ